MALTSLSIGNLERNGRIVQFAGSHGSVSCGLTPVDVESLARHKCGPLKVEDPVDDVDDVADFADFAEPAEREKAFHTHIGRGVVPRPDDPQSDSVHANPARRVLNRQRACGGGETALGECRQRSGCLAVGVVREAGGDVDHVARRPGTSSDQ